VIPDLSTLTNHQLIGICLAGLAILSPRMALGFLAGVMLGGAL